MPYKVEGAFVPIDMLVMGMIPNNVYIIGAGESLFLVDPTCSPDRILAALGDRVPAAIVLTHQHWDHMGAAAAMREATGAPVIAHELDAPYIEGTMRLPNEHHEFEPCKVDRVVVHDEIVQIGQIAWRVIHTPGHSPGSMCLFAQPEAAEGANLGADLGRPVLVSGDTLFSGATGRTDFWESNPDDMRTVALPRLAQLPDETLVLPGHNDLTTIGLAWRYVFPYFGIMR